MRHLPLAAAMGCTMALAACDPGDGLPPPTAPLPPSPDYGQLGEGPVQVRFDGVFYAPHQVLEFRPGARIELRVVAEPRNPSIGPTPPQWTSFVIQTDAPPALLSLSREIRSRDVEVEVIGSTEESVTAQAYVGIVEIEVREPADEVGIAQTYELRIVAPGDGFREPYEISIEPTPLRFRVAAREAQIPCDVLTLTAQADGTSGPAGSFFSRLFPDVTEFRTGRLTLRSTRFGVGMRLPGPYRLRGGELAEAAWDPSAQRKPDATGHPMLFIAGMELMADGDGFEQTFTPGWFDDLELSAHAPGCEPLRIHCDARGACHTE